MLNILSFRFQTLVHVLSLLPNESSEIVLGLGKVLLTSTKGNIHFQEGISAKWETNMSWSEKLMQFSPWDSALNWLQWEHSNYYINPYESLNTYYYALFSNTLDSKEKNPEKISSCVPVTGSGRELWLCHVAKVMNMAKVTAILALCFRKSSESFLAGLEIFT